MKQWARKKSGFTIVELLIVVVVIAILAAITIVAYNGIQARSKESAVKSMATQAYKKVEAQRVTSSTYPATLGDVGIVPSSGYTYDYRAYSYGSCVSVSNASTVYHVSTDNTSPTYGTCGQVKAEYFNNTSLSGVPALTRFEDQINNVWGGGSPAPGVVNNDSFSARYTTYIVPPISGDYTFYTNMDDGERLIVNGVTLGDYFGAGPCCTTRTMPVISLAETTPVPVILEFREGGGSAYIRLLWSYTGQSQVVVPTAAFVRTL